MTKTISLDQLSHKLQKAYQKIENWRKVAAQFGISSGLAYRIAKQGYEPKQPHLRHKLGLPALAPAATCPECGEVHVRKTCPRKASARPKHKTINIGKATEEERQAIKLLTPEERLQALLQAAKEKEG
jgi:hypothetical protein